MSERWIECSPDARQRQEERFALWSSTENIPFISEDNQAQFIERSGLIKDAIQLKKTPARIPVCPSVGHFPFEYAKVSWRDALYDYEKLNYAWKKFHDDFDLDASGGPANIPWGPALDVLGMLGYKWPGGTLGDDHEYQFVDQEYMLAEEYHDLIDDPTGYFLNVYFPRMFNSLKGLSRIGCLPAVNEIAKIPSVFSVFGTKEVREAFDRINETGDILSEWMTNFRSIGLSLKARGIPSFTGGYTKAPFDVIGDCLRGTRGIFLDMFRHPDLLLETCDRLVPFMIKDGINSCNASRHLILFMPLHKGADAFMSEEQYRKFYWPSLRKVIIGLVDYGIVPLLFAEGSYDRKMEVIGDVPEGSVVWWFENSNMELAKKTVGQVACICGNVPLDLLCTSTPDEVRYYCRKLIDTAGKDGGFILSTAAGIQGSKPENIKAMLDFAREYGVY